jgi:chemotaxis response regulator CheB
MDTLCTGRVFIVEDSAPIRSRLVEMLGAVEGLCIVGEAESPAEAVAGISETRPDCVVLDLTDRRHRCRRHASRAPGIA